MSRTQIDSSLVPSASAAYQNVPNILDNAGFDVWQRGTTLSLGGGGQVTLDRWNYPGVTGGAVTVSKETTITHNSAASLKFNITNAGSSTIAYLFQVIENYLDYAGRTVSLSAWVNTTMSNVRIALQNGVVQSAVHPGDGQWHQLTVTTTLATNITFLNAFMPFIGTGLTTGIVYVDSAMLIIGSTPIEHVPTPPEVDLARCQRYLTIITGGSAAPSGTMRSTTTADLIWKFPVTMRTNPTISFSSPTITVAGAASGRVLGSPTVNAALVDSTFITGTITAAGATGVMVVLDGGTLTASAEL